MVRSISDRVSNIADFLLEQALLLLSKTAHILRDSSSYAITRYRSC